MTLPLFDLNPIDLPKQEVLEVIDRGQYGQLAPGMLVWIDAQQNWCFLGIPDGHQPALHDLAAAGTIRLGTRTAQVRLGNQPHTVRLWERT